MLCLNEWLVNFAFAFYDAPSLYFFSHITPSYLMLNCRVCDVGDDCVKGAVTVTLVVVLVLVVVGVRG